jgi:hypothetical protein
MPIRLNLLAEAQAAEESRRRDPLKRAAVGAVVLVALMLMWSSSVQLKVMLAKSDLGRLDAQISARANQYKLVLDNQKKINGIKDKLAALQHLSTNRFLSGTLLNALQHTTVDDVQLMHLHLDQTYSVETPPKPRPGADRSAVAAGPSVTEHVMLTLDANDASLNPGDQVTKFKEAVALYPYFQETLDRTNAVSLKSMGALSSGTSATKAAVAFSLECRYRDRSLR